MLTIRGSVSTIALLGLSWTASAQPAYAHFLWVRIENEAAPTLRLQFTEQVAEKTLPALLEKIKPARVWIPNGETVTLRAGEGALESGLPAGTRLVAAEQVWGVLDKQAQGRGVFLLRYYAKAAVSLKAAADPVKLATEVFARREGAKLVVVVFHAGKPAAGAEVVVVRPGNENLLALKTDASGEARFTVANKGVCGVRAMVEEQKAGEYEGKSYKLARNYSTLTFPIGEASAETTIPGKADPDAYALLKSAHDSRYLVPPTFGGVQAEVVLNDNGRSATGTLTYTKAGDTDLQIEGVSAEARNWLHGQLSNAFGHRRGGDFAEGDGRHPITFTKQGENVLLGRQVRLNDELGSSYRVRDKVVTEVTRKMGAVRFTITVLEAQWLDSGKYLPRHFTVSYFRAKTGELLRAESFSDVYTPIEGIWLPASRRVVTAENGQITAREFTLKNLRLLSRVPAAKP